MSAINLWTILWAKVLLVNGPRSANTFSWEHVTEKTRSHVLSYLDARPEHAERVVDLMQRDLGTYNAQSAWATIEVPSDSPQWMSPDSTQMFCNSHCNHVQHIMKQEKLTRHFAHIRERSLETRHLRRVLESRALSRRVVSIGNIEREPQPAIEASRGLSLISSVLFR
ncbi:unnamed protein product [Heligmosomoides polygyrus]|uniref:Uncharacterized protein n=1 Tax=Heligmosomoides polygyrus TaxID=6339 RepID=A0A183FFS2_HELPZ|nr:unnamed protein product [Heligmosomoides polygyrus]